MAQQLTSSSSPIGRDTLRIDGPRKVTGLAKYTSDFQFSAMLYAVRVEATVAHGKLLTLDTALAEKMPGVRAVLHRQNIGPIFRSTPAPGFERVCLERRPPFEDDTISYWGQYIALAVADTFEAAKAAADAVRATYSPQKPNGETRLQAASDPKVGLTAYGPVERVQSDRGDVAAAFKNAAVTLDETYVTPAETHNPLELHATVASWDGATLTLYDATQGVVNLRSVLAQMFGLPTENVRVVSMFLGSGFGGKLYRGPHVPLAAAVTTVGQAGEAGGEPENDVPVCRTSGAHPAARSSRRVARRQARVFGARVRLSHVDARHVPRRLRRSHAIPVQRSQPAGEFRAREAQR